MSAPERLSAAAIADALAARPAWRLSDDGLGLHRVWHFKDFRQAWAFMGQVARLAERQGHHPDWRNVYGLVEITLTTHDCGGLSARDLALAAAIDRLE